MMFTHKDLFRVVTLRLQKFQNCPNTHKKNLPKNRKKETKIKKKII